MSVAIRKITIDILDRNPNTLALFDEYAEESSIKGLPHPAAKLSIYNHLEASGALVVFGAYNEDELIGFVTVLAPVVPHYGILIAVAESLFVAKKHRKTGAGLRLIREAEIHAANIGSPGIMFSSPSGGILGEVLPRVGYNETNRVFFKKFNEPDKEP